MVEWRTIDAAARSLTARSLVPLVRDMDQGAAFRIETLPCAYRRDRESTWTTVIDCWKRLTGPCWVRPRPRLAKQRYRTPKKTSPRRQDRSPLMTDFGDWTKGGG
jgi:hypothetical protein